MTKPLRKRGRALALVVIRESDEKDKVLFDGMRQQTYQRHRHMPAVRAVHALGMAPMDKDRTEIVVSREHPDGTSEDVIIPIRRIRHGRASAILFCFDGIWHLWAMTSATSSTDAGLNAFTEILIDVISSLRPVTVYGAGVDRFVRSIEQAGRVHTVMIENVDEVVTETATFDFTGQSINGPLMFNLYVMLAAQDCMGITRRTVSGRVADWRRGDWPLGGEFVNFGYRFDNATSRLECVPELQPQVREMLIVLGSDLMPDEMQRRLHEIGVQTMRPHKRMKKRVGVGAIGDASRLLDSMYSWAPLWIQGEYLFRFANAFKWTDEISGAPIMRSDPDDLGELQLLYHLPVPEGGWAEPSVLERFAAAATRHAARLIDGGRTEPRPLHDSIRETSTNPDVHARLLSPNAASGGDLATQRRRAELRPYRELAPFAGRRWSDDDFEYELQSWQHGYRIIQWPVGRVRAALRSHPGRFDVSDMNTATAAAGDLDEPVDSNALYSEIAADLEIGIGRSLPTDSIHAGMSAAKSESGLARYLPSITTDDLAEAEPSSKQAPSLAQPVPVAFFSDVEVVHGMIKTIAAGIAGSAPVRRIGSYNLTNVGGDSPAQGHIARQRTTLQSQIDAADARVNRCAELAQETGPDLLRQKYHRDAAAAADEIERLRGELMALPEDELDRDDHEFTVYADQVEAALGRLGDEPGKVSQETFEDIRMLMPSISFTRAEDLQWWGSVTVRLNDTDGSVRDLGPFHWQLGAGGSGSTLAHSVAQSGPADGEANPFIRSLLLDTGKICTEAVSVLTNAPFRALPYVVLHQLNGHPFPDWVPDDWRAEPFGKWVTSVYTDPSFAWLGRGKYALMSHFRQLVTTVAATQATITALDVRELVPVFRTVQVREIGRDHQRSEGMRPRHASVVLTDEMVTIDGTRNRLIASVMCKHCKVPATVVARVPEVPRDLLCRCGRMPEPARFDMPADVVFPTAYADLELPLEACIAELRRKASEAKPRKNTRAILELLVKQGTLSRPKLAVALEISDTTAGLDLRALKRAGLVLTEGTGRFTTWRATEQGVSWLTANPQAPTRKPTRPLRATARVREALERLQVAADSGLLRRDLRAAFSCSDDTVYRALDTLLLHELARHDDAKHRRWFITEKGCSWLVANPAQSVRPGELAPTARTVRTLAVLQHAGNTGAYQGELKLAVDTSASSIRTTLQNLMAHNYLRHDGKKPRTWLITGEGRDWLERHQPADSEPPRTA
jgi:hypothetical protein